MALTNQLTEREALKLNNDNPENQLVQLGSMIKEVQDEIAPGDLLPLLQYPYAITADASGGVDVFTNNSGFSLRLVNVTAQPTAASGGGTVTIRNGTDAITDAIVIAVDNTLAQAATIDDDYATIADGETVTLITNGGTDRAIITLAFVKI